MDKLDKMTVFGLTVLTLYASVLLLLSNDQSQADQVSKRSQAARQYIINPELDNKIQLAKNLMAQDNLEKTELLVDSLVGEFPYEGKLYMLKGDILMRRQQPIAAMYEYKEAVTLNPDFLDKKTKLFQGKKIKITVEEAMAMIESGLQQNPDNSKLKDDRKTVYFMKRKIAGSCG
jgi:tetratricopeptide (TPR) repeat protein